jgi:hypothetical protein
MLAILVRALDALIFVQSHWTWSIPFLAVFLWHALFFAGRRLVPRVTLLALHDPLAILPHDPRISTAGYWPVNIPAVACLHKISAGKEHSKACE